LFDPITVLLATALLALQEPDVPTQADVAVTTGETVNPDNVVPAEEAANPVVTLPAFTPVDIEILTPLNSKTTKMGEFFDIRLAEPIMLDGRIIVPAGAVGQGEVIHSAKARAGGKAGELILAARYIEDRGQKILLRSFKFGATTGKSNRDGALIAGVVVAAPLVLFISGGNVDVPAGTRAQAKTSEDNQVLKQEEM
jgi:hypothetical protein